MSAHRVVMTGFGPVCAIGIGRPEMAGGLRSGQTGIKEMTMVDSDELPSSLAAEVPAFEMEAYLETRQTYLDRASQFALVATELALGDAGLSRDAVRDAALIYGTAYGCMDSMGLFFEDFIDKGPRLVKPFLFPHTYSNSPISLVAIEFGIRGYHANYTSGSVASGCAILDAFDRIRMGGCELAVVGGTDAIALPLVEGMSEMGLLSPGTGGDEICAPFSSARNGTILGEGAVSVILESLEHAQARDATIIAELTGASITAGFTDDSGSCSAAIHRSLLEIASEREAPAVVLAGANGGILEDAWMAEGIGAFLREKQWNTPVGSIVPLLGNTLGASSVFQLAAAALIMEAGHVPPLGSVDAPVAFSLIDGAGIVGDLQSIVMTEADRGGSVISLSARKFPA